MKLIDLHEKLKNHIIKQNENWKSVVYAKEKGFYQGYDKIKLNGWRPSELRFDSYDIKKYLDKEKIGLDIGSNCGFFTLHVSDYLKSMDGVEINPYLVDISKDTKEYLKIKNSTFYNCSFENFKTNKKYDIIFSLANDSTIDGNTKFNFSEYIQKIIRLLSRNGIIIFESQAMDMMPPSKFDPKLNYLKEYFSIIDDRFVISEYPVNVPYRKFLILKLN
jgi:hypothetical protein|tara:strand:- start:7091 stop:7747 length:657 start_codon:yes stop_codon:yes gene_type:complete